MIIQHKQYKCEVVFSQYENGNTAIQLMGAEDTSYEGELISVATVNGGARVGNKFVGIKTWSENAGIAESLIDGNVIKSKLLGTEPTGFVAIEYYKLTNQALKELEKQKNS